MAIYTRYGSEVEIIGAERKDQRQLYLKVQFKNDPLRIREYHIFDFKATNGVEEIMSNPYVVALLTIENLNAEDS